MTPIMLVLVFSATVQAGSSELNGTITGIRTLTPEDSPYTVRSDVIITKDATLNVEPGVSIRFAPAVGLQVQGTLRAQGNSTSRITLTRLQSNDAVDLEKLNSSDSIPYSYWARINGSGNYRTGRLEVRINNEWGSVCYDSNWGTYNVKAACKMLGFMGGVKAYRIPCSNAGKPLMASVRCRGQKENLFSCHYILQTPRRPIRCRNNCVGIKCHTLPALLKERVHWSGISYRGTANPVELRYVDIHAANVGVLGVSGVLPSLFSVSITSSIRGIKAADLRDVLFIHDTVVSNNMLQGIEISSRNSTLSINNSIIGDTTYGDGMEYSRTRTPSADLSEVDPNSVSFPLSLLASSKPGENEDTIKVFKTSPGHVLTLHFRYLSGQGYYIEVRDGDNINSPLLTMATHNDSGKDLPRAVATGNMIWIRYHHAHQNSATVELLITEDESSLTIMNSAFTRNHGFGLVLGEVYGHLHMENTHISSNTKNGMKASYLVGTVSGSQLRFKSNSWSGAAFYHSNIYTCYLWNITASANGGSGIQLQSTLINCSISNSSFARNSHQGLLTSGVSGALRLNFCDASKNGGSGINMTDTRASVSILSSFIRQNFNNGLEMRRQAGQHRDVNSGTLNIEFCNISSNTLSGIDINQGLVSVSIYSSYMLNNGNHGVKLDKVNGEQSLRFCNISSNGQSGFNMNDGLASISIYFSHILGNGNQGLKLRNISGELSLEFCNISGNGQSGIDMFDGIAPLSINFTRVAQNGHHGMNLYNQAGEHRIVDSIIEGNKRHGIGMYDVQSSRSNRHIPRRRFTGVNITGSDVSNNLYNGIYLGPACQRAGYSTKDVSIEITHSKIYNNSRGGFRMAPYSSGSQYKQVTLVMLHNQLQENKKQAFCVSCVVLYRLKAEIRNNTFYNNSGQGIVLYSCGFNKFYNPVEVNITQNQFIGNRGSNLVYIDFMGFSSNRKANIYNNTYQYNSIKLLFPNVFQRSIDKALVVLKEGTFTFQNNSFEANHCLYLLSTLYVNHNSIVHAEYNWWDTKDECKIRDKIFDFYDRIQLAKVEYFPFFLSSDDSELAITNLTHMDCFLKNNTIGGALDGELILPRSITPYKVRGDILVLENASLRIPSNTTLMFPARSAMMVQGELHVTGNVQEKVNFVKDIRQESIRLSGGRGPWEGVVEFYLNNSWIPVCHGAFSLDVTPVCRHLGYIENYHSYSFITPKATDAFVFGMKCLDSNEDDIVRCKNKTVAFGYNCNTVSTAYCTRDYWAGIHLAFTKKKSELHHLNIYDAGFNYRSDINIPGYALRVDFDHHNFSNIDIRNSSGLGIQVLFPSPFMKKSFIPNSKIVSTASHGILLGSPYLKLTDVEVESTGAAGFILQSQWDSSTSHATQAMSPSIKRIHDFCSQNVTYLKEDDIVYLSSALPYGTHDACQHLFATEQGRRLGIQVLHSQLHQSRLHAYDGNNITAERVWKIETFDNKDRKVFNSSNNEVLLLLEKRYSTASFRLLLFSIKDEKPFESFIEIENSKFDQVRGGISIFGNVISHLEIINCSVSNSGGYLKIDSREITNGIMRSVTMEKNAYGIDLRYNTGDFCIYNSNISQTANYAGLRLHSSSSNYHEDEMVFKLLNCTINHGYQGFAVDGYFSRAKVVVQNNTFDSNKASALSCYIHQARQNLSLLYQWNSFESNQGVTIPINLCTSNTECKITENSFENNFGSVITTRSCGYGNNNILVRKNIFNANQCKSGAVIAMYRQMEGLEASQNVFEFNQGVILLLALSYYSGPLKMLSNVYRSNNCTGKSLVEIQIIHSHDDLVFDDNIFERNVGKAVLSTGTSGYCDASLQVRRNVFRFNKCTEKSVLHIIKQQKGLGASGNEFRSNLGATLVFESVHNAANLLFADNTVENNTCISRGLLSILRMEGNIEAHDNTFQYNKAKGIISVQSLNNVAFNQARKSFSIVNNTLTDNRIADEVRSTSAYFRNSCVLILRGLLYHKITKFFQNKFANPSFDNEFCLRVRGQSQKDMFNATFNWWGTSDNYILRKRISDFDDNHDFAIASTTPFLTSDNDNMTAVFDNSLSPLRGNELGGRVNETLLLTVEASPYQVISDLTILAGVVLTIEPNVELRFSPGVSLLVIGTLIARGTKERKIKFTLDNPEKNQSIRLKDGHFPWEGRLEVYKNSKWMPVCCAESAWNPANTKVICRELGYLPHHEAHHIKLNFEPREPWPFNVECYGNETSLSECNVTEHSLTYNATEFVGLNCKGEPWGNIGFVKSSENGSAMDRSVLEHVEIRYCGQHFNSSASGVESIIETPVISDVSIHNCTFHGFGFFLASNNITASTCEVKHLKGSGFYITDSNNGVHIKDTTIESNANGVYMNLITAQNIPSVHYGRFSLCDPSTKTLEVEIKTLVYFELTDIDTEQLSTMPYVYCQKEFIARPQGKGLRIRLLFYRGSQTIKIYDKSRTHSFEHNYPGNIGNIWYKDLIFPELVKLEWYGDLKTRIMFEIDVVDVHSPDMPCNFQYGLCGWQSFSNMAINGIDMTRTWVATNDYFSYSSYYGSSVQQDHSFYSFQGYVAGIGQSHWGYRSSGNASLFSPLITSQSKFCKLVFYYKFGRSGKSSLSAFLQKGRNIFNRSSELILLWKPNQNSNLYWRKAVLPLPQETEEYRIIFLGSYQAASNSYNRNFVLLDDVELQKCTAKDEFENNIIRNSKSHGISIFKSDSRHTLSVKRNQFIKNGNSDSSGAMYAVIKDITFLFTNNHVAANAAGVYVQTQNSDGQSTEERNEKAPESWIYGNTFLQNGEETLHLVTNQGVAAVVHIKDNYFSNNYGKSFRYRKHSTVKISGVPTKIEGNFFFNNSGLVILNYDFFSDNYEGQHCTGNTFFLNIGTASEYGTTIRTNGPMQYHGNSLKNPHNLYEIETTASSVTNPVNATKNWFGFGLRSNVKSRIRDKQTNRALPKVLFDPFVKIQPRNILSLGCPPDWMNMGSTCYVFRSGVQSFQEADEYCKYYGGHILSSSSPGDKELLSQFMGITPTYGQPPLIPLWIIGDDVENITGDDCRILTEEGRVQKVPCNSHYSFGCSRKAVIRCPNGCFHNGDCIGSTCFCYRGWTGEDCSKHHCRDVHNCSDVGVCIGPNVCRCNGSFQGRACSYSYCPKFRNCSTCVSDRFCGWCDEMQQCLPGYPSSPHKKSCPDWFYYNCYTVGSGNKCSENIWRVDCQRNQCNFERPSTNLETCTKCRDLEKCYNLEEAEKCRAWNATRCPDGMLHVDYSDKNRINNTQLRSNVKVIDPKMHTVYNCPLVLPGGNDVTSVFVVPTKLGIKVGHVITSPQAGGVMHKVNKTDQLGPYTLVLGEEAELKEVIEYADFQTEVQPKQITDEVTDEEEPNKEQINGIMDGSLPLNNTHVHVIPQDKYIYKCIGHLYQMGSKSVVSHYLVMEAVSSINANPGDVVVTRESHGFIERVTNIKKTETATFIHTILERCNGNSTWNTKFVPRLAKGDDDILCSGGDNNPGLIISESQTNIRVNDSIIGRRSQAFVSKVITSSVNGDYVILEVLPVTSVVSGTAMTEVQIDELHVKHRRARRDINYRFSFPNRHAHDETLKLGTGAQLKVQESFDVSVDVTFKFGIFREKGPSGQQEIRDAILGIEIYGKFFATLNLELLVETQLSFEESKPIVRSKQLGKAFCIPIGPMICIMSAFFFELNLKSKITAKTSTEIQTGYTFAIDNLLMAGTCSLALRGCYTRAQTPSTILQTTHRNIRTYGMASLHTMIEPTLSFKLPVRTTKPPISFKSWENVLKMLKNTKLAVDVSKFSPVVVSLSIAVPFGAQLDVTPCFPSNKWNNELNVDHSYGTARLEGILSAELFDWDITKTLYDSTIHRGLRENYCVQLYPTAIKDKCQCQKTTVSTTTLSTQATTEITTKKTTPKTQPTTWTLPTRHPPTGRRPTPTREKPQPPLPCNCPYGQKASVFSSLTGGCDCLPTCKDGAPVMVNGIYECPEYPPGGQSPNCVFGRKGPNCSQPDFYPCTSKCSGNGFPVVHRLQASCRCLFGWTGLCCDIRVPIANRGDPHLQTLDGIEFDYFGIGEFWGCRSIHNSFGLQFRFFAHKGTSLIGGIALKAGRSIVSVMSRITTDPTDLPHLRIDGSLVNLTIVSEKLSIDNKTALLEVQKQSDAKNEGEVVFLSLEYKSGAVVTIYVRHSNTMGRQFLNVLYTLNGEFKEHTEGICGLMDNNQANDLTGPNGELYSDPVKFADSWRISATQNESGLYDSWSWNTSNFHGDDVMDSSYTDPSHVPTYTLTDVPSDILESSRQICEARELPDNLLKSCIYDVALTNDTSFAMQEAFLTGCPDQCSGKGRCINQTCECLGGWSGEKCQIGSCPNCSNNGNCVRGFCQCKVGWEGHSCDEKATCYGVNNCTSPVHGICKTTNKCLCNDGYMGRDCSIVPTCLNVSSCSNHGTCVDFDVCKCDRDWTGKDCSQYSCRDLDYCSGHGRCVNVYQCECQTGWTGISCALPDCPDVNQCNGNGTCVAPNKCQCYPGYSGNGCLDSADCSMLANCSDHGACLIEDGKNASCRCYGGFRGVDCSQPTCNGLNNCSNHGVCKESGFCECDVGFSGSDCSDASCEALNYCSGHGECIDYDVCKCESLWHGAACSTPDCTTLNDCSKQGVCLAPNKCECYPGYDGIKCDKPARPNYFPPVFSSPVYNVSVYENATLGSFVGQVNASDLDQGRNGEVMYFLSNDVGGGLFTVEGGSGKIFTSSSLRYDVLRTDFVVLDVRASDNGKPMKFTSCKVYIEIIDVNDYCPMFDPFLQTSYNISVNTKVGTVVADVVAVDKDNGVNGDVRYHLENGNGIFSVDRFTGSIQVMFQVQPMSYHVVVIARDQGTPSCSSSLKLVIHGKGKETAEPTSESWTTATTTDALTTSNPVVIESPKNSLLENVSLIVGCAIGICFLAVMSTFIIMKIVKLNSNQVVPFKGIYKTNSSPKSSRTEIMIGKKYRVSPDFQGDHDIEMQAWSNESLTTTTEDLTTFDNVSSRM